MVRQMKLVFRMEVEAYAVEAQRRYLAEKSSSER
jgi:hypothetical protein